MLPRLKSCAYSVSSTTGNILKLVGLSLVSQAEAVRPQSFASGNKAYKHNSGLEPYTIAILAAAAAVTVGSTAYYYLKYLQKKNDQKTNFKKQLKERQLNQALKANTTVRTLFVSSQAEAPSESVQFTPHK